MCGLKTSNKWKTTKNYWTLYVIKKKKKKKNCALYKMWQISKEASKKCEIEIFDYGRYISINWRHMKIE